MISFTAAGAETVKLAVFSAGVPFAIAFTVYTVPASVGLAGTGAVTTAVALLCAASITAVTGVSAVWPSVTCTKRLVSLSKLLPVMLTATERFVMIVSKCVRSRLIAITSALIVELTVTVSFSLSLPSSSFAVRDIVYSLLSGFIPVIS